MTERCELGDAMEHEVFEHDAECAQCKEACAVAYVVVDEGDMESHRNVRVFACRSRAEDFAKACRDHLAATPKYDGPPNPNTVQMGAVTVSVSWVQTVKDPSPEVLAAIADLSERWKEFQSAWDAHLKSVRDHIVAGPDSDAYAHSRYAVVEVPSEWPR
jgi:hypothetical protein